jgi:colanic acid/amylovoran biosynthesis glycosyltransferase
VNPATERTRRVLVLTSTFPASKGDGTPEFVLTLAEALAAHDSITVVAPRVAGSARREHIGAVDVRRFAYFPRRWEGLADGAIMPNLRAQPWRIVEAPFLVLAMIVAAGRVARETQPDVVHAHWLLPAGLVAVVLRVTRRIPFVLTVHGADAYALRGVPARVLRRVVLRRASAVVPVSRDIATRLGLPAEAAVPMGVDAAGIRRAVGARTPEAGRVFFVGRLAEKKGVDVLIDALRSARAASVYIGGDGPLRDDLESRAHDAQFEPGRVVFLGRIGRDRVMDELARASVFVIPSKVAADGDQDGTPVVLAEAMAAGVPVLASALGGLGDHVVDGETGVLVAPDDPDALGTALQQMLDDPVVTEALGRRGQERLGTLDVEQTRVRYSSLFDAAIGSTPRPDRASTA